MSEFTRYAIYYLPPEGPFAQFGAQWLGWDVATATPCPQTDAQAALTRVPRKYGFHATLKPPFFLADGKDAGGLAKAVEALAKDQASVRLDGLALSQIGRFLALTSVGDTGPLNALAARIVQELDLFRAPPSDAELARRRAGGLSAAQETNLQRWGYPYVMDEFRFHMTLSGKIDIPDQAKEMILPRLEGIPLAPYTIDTIALVGERDDGLFELVQRYTLSG